MLHYQVLEVILLYILNRHLSFQSDHFEAKNLLTRKRRMIRKKKNVKEIFKIVETRVRIHDNYNNKSHAVKIIF